MFANLATLPKAPNAPPFSLRSSALEFCSVNGRVKGISFLSPGLIVKFPGKLRTPNSNSLVFSSSPRPVVNSSINLTVMVTISCSLLVVKITLPSTEASSFFYLTRNL
ncbi:MAG: hypothetical protein P8Q14_10780 [Vicingaceae bacterium]|nr:hypothetical protein [Vicingaceae bacterium]